MRRHGGQALALPRFPSAIIRARGRAVRNEQAVASALPSHVLGERRAHSRLDGQQPRHTYVARNYVHEWGHYEKQSSMWSNNKACLAQIESNVVFNGPRAGVNFNDG